MKIKTPTQYPITQLWGNPAKMYTDLGYKGHNGIDFGCPTGTPIVACLDGIVEYAGQDSSGGIGVYLIHEKEKMRSIYWHFKNYVVRVGDKVKKGDIVGISDNTGKYTTGNHLHFGLKRCDKFGNTLNYNNGYKGAIDPTPWLAKGFYNLPVDERYGEATYLPAETLMRVKYPKLNTRQIFAMMYGAWKISEVTNPSLLPVYAFLKREQFVNGVVPPFKLIM